MIQRLKRLFKEPQFPNHGKALDVGFGSGEATRLLAQHGFDVVAIDADAEKVKIFAQKNEHGGVKNINVVKADIKDFHIDPEKYVCIFANNVLPFIAQKDEVVHIVERLFGGLVQGGFLLFSLYGPKDAWSEKKNMSFFEYDEALKVLKDMRAEMYFQSTEEGFGPMASGEIKFWHIHKFIVRKK